MKTLKLVLSVLVAATCISCAATGDSDRSEAGSGEQVVLVLVDKTAYGELRESLEIYFKDIQAEFPVKFKVLADDFYNAAPPAIREKLHAEYKASNGNVVGAIMAGPIPVAMKYIENEKIYIPANLYYEDFDGVWSGPRSAEGIFTDLKTDELTNATEIWTAWWVPPAKVEDRAGQIAMLKVFLAKLHDYHTGKIVGRDSMVFLTSPRWNQVENGEAWTVLMRDAITSTGQSFKLYSGNPEAEEHVAPASGQIYTQQEFIDVMTKNRWQHMELLLHGAPNGFYWMGGRFVSTEIDLSWFDQTGANILTSAGCSNGNFRGHFTEQPRYEISIGNVLLFSPRTITVSYFGSAAPQSCAGFASYSTELFRSLRADGNEYFAEGYYRMRNTDLPWGLKRYMFRWADEKILSGDPFVKYRK